MRCFHLEEVSSSQDAIGSFMQSGRKSAKPSGTVVERPLPTLGVNQPAGKPQIRSNVHYRYAEVRLLKPGIQRRWLAKDAPLPFRFASRFFNRFPVALPLRCFHLEETSSSQDTIGSFMQSGRKSAKPSGTVVERPLPTLGVNQPAGKPQTRNNVHYRSRK